jgi:hypothetical protein
VPKKRKGLNLEIVGSNLAEAVQELERLRNRASDGTLSEEAFQVGLLHAYHHLNFAWNIRRVETRDYANLTQKQFERWGKYPSKIDPL